MGSKIGGMKVAARRAGISVEEYIAKQAEGLKWCYRCKTWTPIIDFTIQRSRRDGLSPTCRPCNSNGLSILKDDLEQIRRDRIKEAWVKRRETFVPPMKGKKMSEESRKKMSDARKGRPGTRTGIRHTDETRAKISAILRERAARGEKVSTYKDGKVAERRGIRFSTEYRRWRYDVFARDRFTCQHCGDNKGGNLNAHHIQPFADFPDLRFDIDNGITLCETCHKAVHAR